MRSKQGKLHTHTHTHLSSIRKRMFHSHKQPTKYYLKNMFLKINLICLNVLNLGVRNNRCAKRNVFVSTEKRRMYTCMLGCNSCFMNN